MEAARALAAMAKAGNGPRRTVIFATWDAEEWGLIGSTEFVEQDTLRLNAGAVAYLNQDVAAQGSSFGASGSPSLRGMLRDVLGAIPDPSGGQVMDRWRAASNGAVPAMGDPGGGSDFAGFYNHLGIPILEWGFGGRGGVYHSQYDDYYWMTKFGDPGFRYHAAAARVAAATILRLANADVLPYDYVEFAKTMRQYVGPIDKTVSAKGWTAPTQAIVTALDQMESAATKFAEARDAALQAGIAPATSQRVNAALMRVERSLTRPTGLKTRPWFRGLIYVADEDNGYANMPLPSINEAIRAGNRELVVAEIADLAARFGEATKAIESATLALTGR
jgi:N-acetylated-alpha-linked acidic dipeptidase